jgi:hypothetical protein
MAMAVFRRAVLEADPVHRIILPVPAAAMKQPDRSQLQTLITEERYTVIQ